MCAQRYRQGDDLSSLVGVLVSAIELPMEYPHPFAIKTGANVQALRDCEPTTTLLYTQPANYAPDSQQFVSRLRLSST